LHYAIQKHGWKPSEIEEWLACSSEMRALYFASMELKAEQDRKREQEMKSGNRFRGKKK